MTKPVRMPDLGKYTEIISYARFSSRLQSDGTSEERQQDAVLDFAATHGIQLSSRSATDRGLSGYSGRNLKSGALGTLIESLKQGLIPTPCLLLVERQDRFGRRPTTQTLLTLFGDLFGLGCDLYHLNQRRLYSEEIVNADFGALVTLAAEIHSAHHFSAVLSQRMTVAFQKTKERIAKGEPVRPGLAPAWIDWNGTTWELNAYAATVRRLLELVGSGLGFQATAKALNAEGFTSPKGMKWGTASVVHIFRSPAVAGGRLLERSTMEAQWGYWPELISRQQWEDLKAAVARRSCSYSPPGNFDACYWIGQSLTRCPVCGGPQGRHRSPLHLKSGKVYKDYLRCRNTKNGQCHEPAIPLRAVVAHVLTRLHPNQLALIINSGNDHALSQLQRDVEQLTRERDRAQDAVDGAEAEMTELMGRGEAATAVVMARALPALERKLALVQEQLDERLTELQGMDLHQEIEALGEPLAAMQRTFALAQDSAEERRNVNAAMRRLGLRIEVRTRTKEIGMALGTGDLVWQPITPVDEAALYDGVSGWSQGRDGELLVEPQLTNLTALDESPQASD